MINMNEETFYEGGPAKSDLIINLLAAITLLGLPFTFAAIVRELQLMADGLVKTKHKFH